MDFALYKDYPDFRVSYVPHHLGLADNIDLGMNNS